MTLTIWVGLLGGLLTGISPCVLPLLPVVFFAGGVSSPTGKTVAAQTDTLVRQRTLGRPLAIVGGLVLSFASLVLLGATLVSTLGLPPALLRWIGIGLLALAGVGLIVPRFAEILQRPFNRIPSRQRTSDLNPFALGLVLGTLYLPCAGPVLAAIAVAGATNTIDGKIIALTVAFAVGVAVPLLLFAIGGARLGRRWSAVGHRARQFRAAGGVVLVLFAGATALGVRDPLVLSVPDFTANLQSELAGALAPAASVAGTGSLQSCQAGSTTLADCGPAPEIGQADRWFNTPDNAALTLAQLKGKVVIVDFWTFGCINCKRALPHVEELYQKYRDAGLEVIAVHSPEFDYEHNPDRIAATLTDRGYTFPVAQDNSFGIWTSYHNSYWPALYLIDGDGVVRYVSWGEGNYELTESHVQALLAQAAQA